MNIRAITGPIAAPAPSDSLLIVNLPDREVSATDLVKEMEDQALTCASTVLTVTDARTQQMAVTAQTELARYVKAVTNAAEEAKAPLNQIRGKIIALHKELVAKAQEEGARVGALIADFQIAEEARVAAARRLAEAKASVLEKELDQKIAQAQSLSEIEALRDESRAELAAAAPPIEPIRAPGQVVKEELEVQVFDIWLLARSMPSCVKIEPRLSEIKSLLNAGVKVPGVNAVKKTVAGVRLGRVPEAINV